MKNFYEQESICHNYPRRFTARSTKNVRMGTRFVKAHETIIR